MTAKRTLIEDRLGRDLASYVTELREDGASWTFIAARIERHTNVTVTDQTVRNWFGHLDGPPIGGEWPSMNLTGRVDAVGRGA